MTFPLRIFVLIEFFSSKRAVVADGEIRNIRVGLCQPFCCQFGIQCLSDLSIRRIGRMAGPGRVVPQVGSVFGKVRAAIKGKVGVLCAAGGYTKNEQADKKKTQLLRHGVSSRCHRPMDTFASLPDHETPSFFTAQDLGFVLVGNGDKNEPCQSDLSFVDARGAKKIWLLSKLAVQRRSQKGSDIFTDLQGFSSQQEMLVVMTVLRLA